MRFHKIIFLTYILLTIFISEIELKKHRKIKRYYNHFRFKEKISNKIKRFRDIYQNHVKFIVGLAVGYGLNTEATEQLKECFIKKEKESGEKILVKFLQKAEKNNNSKEAKDQQQESTSFTKLALEFFTKLKDCDPLKETILTFIKNRIINIGVKGIAYILGGPLGLIAKGTYDTIKLTLEVKNFYNLLKSNHKDYVSLGSAVGKIIYYTQNLLLRRRKK